jgi:putative tricarboxylic transport membrane protein
MKKVARVNSTFFVGLGAIAFAIVFWFEARELPEQAQRLPLLLIWIVMALGILMLIENWIAQRRAQQASTTTSQASTASEEEPLAPVNWPVLGIFSAAIATYVLLIPVLGYLITTPLFITGGVLLGQALKPIKAVLVGVVTTLIVWIIFIWLLKLPVPMLPAFF